MSNSITLTYSALIAPGTFILEVLAPSQCIKISNAIKVPATLICNILFVCIWWFQWLSTWKWNGRKKWIPSFWSKDNLRMPLRCSSCGLAFVASILYQESLAHNPRLPKLTRILHYFRHWLHRGMQLTHIPAKQNEWGVNFSSSFDTLVQKKATNWKIRSVIMLVVK